MTTMERVATTATAAAAGRTSVVAHMTPDLLDLLAAVVDGDTYELPRGVPLAMDYRGLEVVVYIAADRQSRGVGIITDIRQGVPAGYVLVNVLDTLALWAPA